METFWIRSKRRPILMKYINRILVQWQLGLREFQLKTYELGYDTTEKANFGFFLWGCARLKMPFILEFTMGRKFRGKNIGRGRPDGRILISENAEAVFEAKRIYDRIDTPPRRQIIERVGLLEKELKSLKWWHKKVNRIGLCFVILERTKKKGLKELDKSLSMYINLLKTYSCVDFLSVYQSPKEIVTKPYNIYKDKRNREFIYPAVVLIGKYV